MQVLRLLVGELRTPKCWPNFAYWKCLYIAAMLLNCGSDLNQRQLKTRHSQQRCVFCGCEQCSPKQLLVNKYFVWNFMPNMLSRFSLIPERDGQTDWRTELLYEYCASSWIFLWLMTLRHYLQITLITLKQKYAVRSCVDYVVKQLVSRLAYGNIGLYATGVWAKLDKNVTRSPLIYHE